MVHPPSAPTTGNNAAKTTLCSVDNATETTSNYREAVEIMLTVKEIVTALLEKLVTLLGIL